MRPRFVPSEIVLPYHRREHFRPFHDSKKRWIFVCAHRRAGKSVAFINQIIKKALQNPRKEPVPRYAYIGPSFAQTKDLIWEYTKQYAGRMPGTRFIESELTCVLPTGARIGLYGGGQAYNRIRGLYLDGAVLDEYPLINPEAFDSVVRPALADYGGFGIVAGTAAGKDHFYKVKQRAEENPHEWDVFVIPVTQTDALHPDEVAEMRRQMTPNQFAREMLCSFDTPVENSYYGDLMVEMEEQGRICMVPYDPSCPVITAWDLGMKDLMTIWWVQKVGMQIRWLAYHQDNGKGLEHYIALLKSKPYIYACHIFPPDIKVRELGSGRARYETLLQHNLNFIVCPEHKPADGIQAVRTMLPMSWMDREGTELGRDALKAYQTAPAPVGFDTVRNEPLHNWASHGADAARHLAVGFDRVTDWRGQYSSSAYSYASNWGRKLRRNVRGVV